MNRASRVVFAVIFVMAPLLGARGVSAQSDATPSPVANGQYTSPDYGYSVAWDDNWAVDEQTAEGGYDLLHIDNGSGDLYFEGEIEYAGDPTVCLSAQEEQLRTDASVSNFSVSSPAATAPGGGETAVFTYTQTDKNGKQDLTESVTCRTLRPGGAVLVITLISATKDYPDVSTAAAPIIDEMTMPTEASETDIAKLVAAAEADLTDFWTQQFAADGKTYQPPTYVNFDKPISTPCGDANPLDIGPFYCPENATVYLDMADLTQDVLPYGPFLVVIVVAHETGHHVEELLGLTYCPKQCDGGYSNEQWELMADCFAGGWAKDANKRGEVGVGALEDAIVGTAAFFGDPPAATQDMPDVDAHGPGSLRTWWLLKGYFEGPSVCTSINQPAVAS